MLMSKEDLAKSLGKKFKYRYDTEQYGKRDAWYIMREQTENGKLEGDCEDFALTLLWHISEHSYVKFWWSLISRKAKVCYCYIETPDRGHAVLRYDGEFADNIQKKFVTKEKMESKGYVFSKWMFIPSTVAIKMLIGKFYKI